MRHGFVKEVFGKGLRVVGCERWDHDNHHLTNNRIAVRPETENLVGSIEKILLHKLKFSYENQMRCKARFSLTMPACSNNSR